METRKYSSKKCKLTTSVVLLLVFALSFISPTPVNAQFVKGDVSIGNFWYWLGTISNPYAGVGSLNSNVTGHYEIPETIDVNGAKFTVNSIRTLAFLNQTYMIKSLTIPQSVDEIEDAAFYNNSNSGLDSLIIKDSPKILDCTQCNSVNDDYVGQFSRTNIKYLYLGRDLKFTPYSVDHHYYNPFVYVNTFETIEIGENVTNFDCFFDLSDSEGLKKIIMHSKNPPACDEYQFSKLQFLNIEIEVPEGTLAQYKSVSPWSNFLNIKESKDKTFTVTANYDENQGTVFVNRSYLNGQQTFSKGDNIELVFLPSRGYSIESVLVNGVERISELVNNSLQLQNVVEDVNVEVKFSLPKLNIKLNSGDGGSYIIPIEYGKTFSVGFTANTGWSLQKVYVNGEDLTGSVIDNNIVLKNIEKETDISAVYVLANGIQSLEKLQPSVRIIGNIICVDNIKDISIIEYYDMNGKLLAKGTKTFRVDNKGAYIIKCGNTTFKVLI